MRWQKCPQAAPGLQSVSLATRRETTHPFLHNSSKCQNWVSVVWPRSCACSWPFHLWPGEWNMPIGQAWIMCPYLEPVDMVAPTPTTYTEQEEDVPEKKGRPGLLIEARERRRYQPMDVHDTQILLLYFPAGCQKEKWEPDRKSQRATTHSLVFCGSVSTSYPCRTLPSNMASGKWRSWSIFGREKYSCRETPLLVMKGKRTLFPDKLKQESA